MPSSADARKVAGVHALVLSLCLLSAPVQDELARAATLVQIDLRYGQAVVLLERITRDPTVDDRSKVVAYRLLAVAYVATNASASATAAFEALLDLEPGHEPDARWSPKIREVFERAKAARAPPAVLLDVTAEAGEAIVTVRAVVDDPGQRLQRVELFSRLRGAISFTARPMRREAGRVQGIAPLMTTDGGTIDYFLRGTDAKGDVIAEAGSPRAPLALLIQRRIRPPKDDDGAWYTRWWIWAVGAAVVAGAVTTGVVLTRDDDDPAPPGTLDPIVLGR